MTSTVFQSGTVIDSVWLNDVNAKTYADTADTVGYLPAGTGAVATTVQDKLRESVSVKDFGAVGNGEANDTKAIQDAIDTGKPVFVPAGTYYLATPLQVTSGLVIYGEAGRLAYWYPGRSILKPLTCAIQTQDYNQENIGCTIRNIGFVGGTLQVDLGLTHEVQVESCEFYNPSVGGLMITRGEKHLIASNRFDFVTGNPIFAMALGRWQESLNPGVGPDAYSDAYFGSGGSWFDRATIINNTLQGGPSGAVQYGILSNVFSGSVISDLVSHGNGGAGGELACIYVRDRIQASVINVVSPDSMGNALNLMPNMFYFGQILNCTFNSVSPDFAGNNQYVNGIYAGAVYRSVFTACKASGDNVTTYGFYFGSAFGQNATLVSCTGAMYNATPSALGRDQVALINCDFDVTNSYGSNSNVKDQDINTVLMADTSGAAAATSTWKVTFASGSGGTRIPFYLKKDAAWFTKPVTFTNTLGETAPQTIQPTPTSNTSPEGVLTANPGSLCLFYNGTTSGALYVKQTGIGNTGWVLK